MKWLLLTGEYPPRPGGVSDYTQQLAGALAGRGEEVRVLVLRDLDSSLDPMSAMPEVKVDWLGGGLGGLRELHRVLLCQPSNAILLLQYVPHAYGWRAMNVPLILLLWRDRKRVRLWIMFHEVAFPLEPGQSWRHRIIALVTRRMAGVLARASAKIFVSIPGWEATLRAIAAPMKPLIWLPVPSNLPTNVDANAGIMIRSRLGLDPSEMLVGNFSTYGMNVGKWIDELLPGLMTACPEAHFLLMGRGSREFKERFLRERTSLAERLHSTGGLPGQELAEHLAACDIMVQPYPDGASSRRGTVMASLALGRPVVTNAGALTESIWRETGCVALAETFNTTVITSLVGELLRDGPARRALGERGEELYRSRFSLQRTVDKLIFESRDEARAH